MYESATKCAGELARVRVSDGLMQDLPLRISVRNDKSLKNQWHKESVPIVSIIVPIMVSRF